MKVILNQKEMGEAVILYLKERGVSTDLGKIYFHRETPNVGPNIYTAEIVEVEMPPKDGPYR